MNRLAYLRRRLKLAKRRLVYWSGRPSFTGFGFRPSGTRTDSDTEYESAMADCDSLADEIKRLCGKRPVVKDVRERIQRGVVPRDVQGRPF